MRTFKIPLILALALFSGVTACSSDINLDDPSYYSNVGFDKGRRPENAENVAVSLTPPATPTSTENYFSNDNQDFTTPKKAVAATTMQPSRPQPQYRNQSNGNYYNRQAQPYPQQPYYQHYPQYQTQPYYPQPVYYVPQPYPPQNYQPQVVPGSRFYTNPYALPPAPQQNQQHDADQYYTPPTQYNSVEPRSSLLQ